MEQIQSKIQTLEIETVKAVTEMRSDIKNLTKVMEELKDIIHKMNKSFVTEEEYNTAINKIHKDIAEARAAGKAQAIIWSVLTAVFTSMVVYEITKLMK